jgi:hypothetical protein
MHRNDKFDTVSTQGDSREKAENTAMVSAINPLAADIPLSQADQAFADRMEANRLKPNVGITKGPCPVWSYTRRGLQSTLDYLRKPTKTGGASVNIGPGGMARGVILEGQAPSDLTFWGSGLNGGTLMLPM